MDDLVSDPSLSGTGGAVSGRRTVETELKLTGDSAALSRFLDSALIRRWAIEEAEETRLITTYHDTPERALKAEGLTLRLREAGGKLLQTVKSTASSSSSFISRFEIETSLRDKNAFPVSSGSPLSLAADNFIEIHRASLQPFLRTDVMRWQQRIRWEDSVIDCVADTGKIVAWPFDGPIREARVRQVELELLDGSVESLFRLARALIAECGLRPTLATKEEIGTRLLAAETVNAVKAGRYALAPAARTEEVIRRSLGAAVHQISGNTEGVEAGDPEAIKQMRVGLRRFRALARLFRQHADKSKSESLVTTAKQYGQLLGDARDWDVFSAVTLPSMIEASTIDGTDQTMLLELGLKARQLRLAARQRAIAGISDPAFAAFCLDLQEFMECRYWAARRTRSLEKPARQYAIQALDKRLGKVTALGADLAAAPAHARHPLRVELKKLRYALHAFRPLYGKEERKPYLSALSRLQDEFGLLNDAVVARQMALLAAEPDKPLSKADVAKYDLEKVWHESLSRSLGASLLIGWTARGLDGQAAAVYEAWQAFEEMPPFWRDA